MKTKITQKTVNDLGYKIVGCAIEVHKQLGPGLLESVYSLCLSDELKRAGLTVKTQQPVPVKYKGTILGGMLKIDMLVNDLIIVELKAVEEMNSLHKAQLLSYLKLSGLPKELLINFNCEVITSQVVSLVTEDFAKLTKQ